MKKLFLVLCVGGLSLTACNREKTTADINTSSATTTTETVEADGTDYENEYRARASRMSARMADEMHFDTTTQAKVEQAYINRQRRLDEIRSKYDYEAEGNVQSGGYASETDETTNMNPDMISELKTVDVEIDNEFRNILSPDQFKMYETNRANYWEDNTMPVTSEQNQTTTQSTSETTDWNITRDGDEINVQSGDIKVKASPGKTKVETPTYESKIKGEERKFKSKVDDTKIKSEPGKAKYESDDTKIKIKD